MSKPATLHTLARHTGEYSVLQLAWPGSGPRNIGVLLLDPATDRLFLRLADLSGEEGDAEYFTRLEEGIREAARDTGAAAFRSWCEDTLSGVLLITDHQPVEVDAFTRVIERLYAEHVERVAVKPYETHLPLYTLRAAAGKFGEERAVEIEPEDWVPAPGGRLEENMFVARVVGRSMEPRIPDGSLNVFRAPVIGSRQNRIVLAERRGLPEDSRFTVKRYTSRKRHTGEDRWEHESVRLEPLNPEFEAFDLNPGDQVIAEWIRTLE